MFQKNWGFSDRPTPSMKTINPLIFCAGPVSGSHIIKSRDLKIFPLPRPFDSESVALSSPQIVRVQAPIFQEIRTSYKRISAHISLQSIFLHSQNHQKQNSIHVERISSNATVDDGGTPRTMGGEEEVSNAGYGPRTEVCEDRYPQRHQAADIVLWDTKCEQSGSSSTRRAL